MIHDYENDKSLDLQSNEIRRWSACMHLTCMKLRVRDVVCAAGRTNVTPRPGVVKNTVPGVKRTVLTDTTDDHFASTRGSIRRLFHSAHSTLFLYFVHTLPSMADEYIYHLCNSKWLH